MLGLLFGGMFAAAARRESADPGDAAAGASGPGDSAGVATTDNDILSMVGTSDNLLISPSAFGINPEIAMYSAESQVLSECQTEPEGNTITSNSFNVESVFGGSGPTPFDIDLSILDAVEHECHLSNEAYLPENGDPLDMGAVFGSSSLSRQEQDLQVWQAAEGERLTKLYQMALDKLGGNIDLNKLTCDSRDNSKTHTRVSTAIKYLREMIDVAPDTGYGESAVEQRDRYVKMISPNFNVENLEEARLNLQARYGFGHTYSNSLNPQILNNGGDIPLDGDIVWSTGKELVNKVNRFIDLGGKLQTLTVNAHGIRNATFVDDRTPEHNFTNSGIAYGDNNRYWQGSQSQPDPNSANWNQINWAGAVNNNFTLFMGSCTGYDDARAILETIISQNQNIEGAVAIGRNFIGSYAGASDNLPPNHWINRFWARNTGPIGFHRYVQAVDGNIVDTFFPHPASEYLPYNTPIGSIDRYTTNPNYKEFLKAMGKDDPKLLQQLAIWATRSNK